MYLVMSLSRDKGSGRYMMYLPFLPYRFLGGKGQIHCVSARPLAPKKGLYQIHGQSLNTHQSNIPRGPKDQKNSRFRSRLKISIENEIFERATCRGPIFCGEIETSRSKFSSEIKSFDRD